MLSEELSLRLTEAETCLKSNLHRIEKLEKKTAELEKCVTSAEVQSVRLEEQEKDLKELRSDMKTVLEKPGRRWDSVVEKVLLVVVGALTAYVMNRLGF